MALVELLFNGPKWASNILKALGVLGISSLFSRSEYSIIFFSLPKSSFVCFFRHIIIKLLENNNGKLSHSFRVVRSWIFWENLREMRSFSSHKKISSNLKEMDSFWLNTFFWGFIFARQWTSDQNMKMSSLLPTPPTSPKSSF